MKPRLSEIHLREDGGYVAVMRTSQGVVVAEFRVRLAKRRQRERQRGDPRPDLQHHPKTLETLEIEARIEIQAFCKSLTS